MALDSGGYIGPLVIGLGKSIPCAPTEISWSGRHVKLKIERESNKMSSLSDVLQMFEQNAD